MTCPHKTSLCKTSARLFQTFAIPCKSLKTPRKSKTSHTSKAAASNAWQTATMQAKFKIFVKKVKSSKDTTKIQNLKNANAVV